MTESAVAPESWGNALTTSHARGKNQLNGNPVLPATKRPVALAQ
ncbi:MULTISPECIES: hypothetical protein [unclassified Erwinia]|nr:MULTISPECIES: hypothetical protein [unclassified Erwinia]